jgi:hypothetical protein
MFAPFRPTPLLLYERVFCSPATSTLAQRVRGALSLTRSFLLLEDDDPVDWEVDRQDHEGARDEPTWASAHRAPLRERRSARRPGQTPVPAQICLCPIEGIRRAPGCAQRGSRITTGSSRVAIDL